ncbi:SIS domain-containing protein [Streptomyces sp. NPDC056405]|uniref:SIS domain-containing protein n=1 Tax=Streptomyces sp. NPDC056405 TaxID=3345811 RepID=UPI0035D80C3C
MSEAAERLGAARRVIVVGTGTSQHAAELGATLLEEAGLDARWHSGAHAARWAAAPREGDVLLVITHTAETAYAVRARSAALALGIPVVSITGRGKGWPEAVETVAPEESETYTVSYTSALGVLARLAHHLGAPEGSPEQLRQTAEAVRAVCAAPDLEAVPVPTRSLTLIGCGPWGVTAREGALKIREAARMLAEGFESDRFLHGAAVPLNAADGLIVLEPAADVDGLTAALGEAGAKESIQVTTLAADPGAPALPPVLAQIPLTVRLQLLAERFAALRHQDPDVAIVGAWADSALWATGLPDEAERAAAAKAADTAQDSATSEAGAESEAAVATR